MNKKEHLKELPVNFINIEQKYTNQTLIQVTENDFGIGFGLINFDEKGNDIVDMHTMMRMSYNQAKKLYKHLGHVFNEMEKQNK